MLSKDEVIAIIKRNSTEGLYCNLCYDIICKQKVDYRIDIRNLPTNDIDHMYIFEINGPRCYPVKFNDVKILILRELITNKMIGFKVVIGNEEEIKRLQTIFNNPNEIIDIKSFLVMVDQINKNDDSKSASSSIIDVYTKDGICITDANNYDPSLDHINIILPDGKTKKVDSYWLFMYAIYPMTNWENSCLIISNSTEELAEIIDYYDLYRKIGGEYIEQDGSAYKANSEIIINVKTRNKVFLNK